MATSADAIAYFRSIKGTHEEPIGSNNVPGITDYLRTASGYTTGPSPWCAEAVSKVVREGGGSLDLSDVDPAVGPGIYTNGIAYVPTINSLYRHRGRFFDSGEPGDLVVIAWGGQGSDPHGDHVELLVEQRADGSCVTVGGNTGGPDGVGDEVAENVRDRSVIVGFCRVQYDASTPPAPVPDPTPAPAPPSDTPDYGHALFLTSPNMMHDDYVTEWQQKMADRGWTISVDGWFGPQSDHVARQFQAEKGLEVDGIVGPVTWAATWTAPVT